MILTESQPVLLKKKKYSNFVNLQNKKLEWALYVDPVDQT